MVRDETKRVDIGSGPGGAPIHFERVSFAGMPPVFAFDLAIPVPHPPDAGQWIVLLGANGSGKTSILRSIALTLTAWTYGATYFHQAFQDRGPKKVEVLGGVHVRQADARHNLAILIEDGGFGPLTQYALPDTFAFGAVRGNALGGPDRDVNLDVHSHAATLFGAGSLIHAETWLRREKLRATGNGRFLKAVLTTVSALLPGGERIRLHRDDVIVETPGGERFPFSGLSDGYLTTLGWTIDLIARWADRYRDTGKLDENFAKDMPCVVLVDELDLHLHPRWQLDIIPRLRAAFPKTTFVVTTHNPLTLQGTRPGEVFVLQKDDATGQISITQRDVPPGTDANRLLTGDWFGLGSTLDESTLRKLDRHRELLRTRRPESDPERRALEQELRVRLNGFADTSYERMALDVIAQLHDEKMRQRKDITAEDRERVVREVRARLAALDGPKGSREPATGAREPAPTYRPAKPPGKAPPRSTSTSSRKPSPRTPTAKPKLAARTKPR